MTDLQTLRKHAEWKSCSCPLKSGMEWEDLIEVGRKCHQTHYVCPVLDKYRRMVGVPSAINREDTA